MWQNKFIAFSLNLQSNSNGGIFRYLTNVNEMVEVMFSSWLINIYFILLPIFTVIAFFLLFQSLRNRKYLFFPKLRYAIPIFMILSLTTGCVVFIQLLEMNEDVNKIQQQSDFYIKEFQYQMYSSINSTKKSLIDSLKTKKAEILPVVENIITDVISIANNRSSSLKIDIFSKSDLIIKVINLGNLYINSTNRVRAKQISLDRQCKLRFIEQSIYCKEFSKECAKFSFDVRSIKKNIVSRQLNNGLFLTTFQTVFPMIEEISKSFKVNQFLLAPSQLYDKGIDLMNDLLDKAVNIKLKTIVDGLINTNMPLLNKNQTKFKIIVKLILLSIILMNIVFLLLIISSVFINYRFKKSEKRGHSKLWTFYHFATYIFGTFVMIIFVTGTSVLMNSQTEVCRYLSDINSSAQVADRYIDAFLDQQGKIILAKNVPVKILSIPNLNLKNPRGILTTIIRQCPAKRILLPSLEMYRPINSTALIFSDFVEKEVLFPMLSKLNETVYDNIDEILDITEKVLESKKHLLEVLKVFPRVDKIVSQVHVSFDTFRDIVFNDDVLEEVSNKLSYGVEIRKQFGKMKMKREREHLQKCFGELFNMTILNENEKLLSEIVISMSYFENLIRDIVATLQNIGDNIKEKKELFFSDFLKAVISPLRIYCSRLISLLEDETLSKVIPCDELSSFYSETIAGLCTNQLGNVLVLMIFGTLTFTFGNILILVIMMSY